MDYKNEKLEEFNNYLKDRKVAVIGLGVSNIPLLDYLYEKKANVTVFDQRNIDDIPKDIMNKISKYSIDFSFGTHYLEKLENFDIIFRSPSCLPTVPELVKEKQRGAIVTTEIEMLMEMCPSTVIGITGSEGKTTTTTLVYEILKAGGYNCYLGGNIGIPLFTKLDEMKPEDMVILEMSSFQLMNMKISPKIAAITNITPNHLNVHKDYEEYINAKKAIFKSQNEDGKLVLNFDNEIVKECSKEAPGKVLFFSSKTKLENGYIVDGNVIKKCEDKIRKHILNTKEIKLRGMHNYENICVALAITEELVNQDIAIEVIKNFAGVPHRIELVKTIDDVKWYNDSASTSPSRLISGLNAFNETIILIAGGADKNLDYSPVGKPILSKVRKLLLIGQTAEKIYKAVENASKEEQKTIDIEKCKTLEETVKLARKYARPGEVVLFSPASTSFDMFKDMYDRGNQFKELVNNL